MADKKKKKRRKRRQDLRYSTVADKMVLNLQREIKEMKKKQKRMEKYILSDVPNKRRKALED